MRRILPGAYGQNIVEKLLPAEGVLITNEKYPFASRHVHDVVIAVNPNSVDFSLQRSLMELEEYVAYIDPEQGSRFIVAINPLGLGVGIEPEMQDEEPLIKNASIQLYYSKDAPLKAEFIVEKTENDTEAELQNWQNSAKTFLNYIQSSDRSVVMGNKLYVNEELQGIIDEASTTYEKDVIEESIKLAAKAASNITSQFKGAERVATEQAFTDFGFIEDFALFFYMNNQTMSWQNLPDIDVFLDASLSVFLHKKMEQMRADSMSETTRLLTIKEFGTDSFVWLESEQVINSTDEMIEQIEEDETFALFTTKQVSEGKAGYGEGVNILGNIYIVTRDGNNFYVELATPRGDGWTVKFPANLDADSVKAKIKDLTLDIREIRKDIPVELKKKAA